MWKKMIPWIIMLLSSIGFVVMFILFRLGIISKEMSVFQLILWLWGVPSALYEIIKIYKGKDEDE
ncbi:MAG: hypothetical protein VB115_08290 [Christensenellaceae bacterium]|nr:hypothetical protein [Christensenellaceae bacterium]